MSDVCTRNMANPLPIFDAHSHLAPDATKHASAEVEPSSSAAGRMLCGVEPEEWDRLSRTVAAWPGSLAAYGVHPWYAKTAKGEWLDELERRLRADPSAWLGEAGLDGLRTDEASPELQEAVFSAQLQLARRLGRPVNLHCVKAWDRLLALLDRDYPAGDGTPPFIVHSFAGPHQFIAELTGRGARFTVGPLFSRRDSRRHRERTALLPDDRLLLESDAFLAPFRDAVDDLDHALHWLAAVRHQPPDVLAARLLENSRRIFNHG